MKKIHTVCLLMFVLFALQTSAQEKQYLKLRTTTQMPGFTGDFDHFGVDLKGNRLFLAAEDHKTVEVFNLRTGARIKSVPGFGQPHAIRYLPDTDQFVVTDGDDTGAVELVSGKDYSIVGTIKLPPGADGAMFNPVNKNYYVESGANEPHSKTNILNIIDTKAFKLAGQINLPGDHSEGMVVDRSGKKLYINLTGADQVGVVDLDKRQVTATWPVPEAEIGNSMVLDEPNHRLFIATRKPPKFIVFNTDTGKVVTSLPCAGINDDMWFDVSRKRIYATGSDTTSVFVQHDADHYEHLAEVPTGFRAKTSLFVPELSRLYIAVSAKGKPDAKMSMQIYEALD